MVRDRGVIMEERFQERIRRERSDTILQETASLAAEKGWDRLRVEDVAQRVGVAKGTIYLDFEDKGQLITAALQRCADDLLDALKTDVDEAPGPSQRL